MSLAWQCSYVLSSLCSRRAIMSTSFLGCNCSQEGPIVNTTLLLLDISGTQLLHAYKWPKHWTWDISIVGVNWPLNLKNLGMLSLINTFRQKLLKISPFQVERSMHHVNIIWVFVKDWKKINCSYKCFTEELMDVNSATDKESGYGPKENWAMIRPFTGTPYSTFSLRVGVVTRSIVFLTRKY